MTSADRDRDQPKLLWWVEREEKLLYLTANRARFELDDVEYDLAIILNEIFTDPVTRRCGPVALKTLGRCIKRKRSRTSEIMKSLVRKSGITIVPPAHQARYKAGGDATEYVMPWDGVRRSPRQRSANVTNETNDNANAINAVSPVAGDSQTTGASANVLPTKRRKRRQNKAISQAPDSARPSLREGLKKETTSKSVPAPSLASASDGDALARALINADRGAYLKQKRMNALAITAARKQKDSQ